MFLRWPNPEWTSMTFRPFDLLTLCTLGSHGKIKVYSLYCTVLYHIVPYCGLDQYTPLVEVNQAICAWSFRQKVFWVVVVVGGWHCNYSNKLQAHSWARLINNRALKSFPSRQEIDKSLKSKKLQISYIFATLCLLYRVIDMPIFIFRFSCLTSECHPLINKDIFTLVMMTMKKSRWFQWRNVLRIAVTKSNWR